MGGHRLILLLLEEFVLSGVQVQALAFRGEVFGVFA